MKHLDHLSVVGYEGWKGKLPGFKSIPWIPPRDKRWPGLNNLPDRRGSAKRSKPWAALLLRFESADTQSSKQSTGKIFSLHHDLVSAFSQ